MSRLAILGSFLSFVFLFFSSAFATRENMLKNAVLVGQLGIVLDHIFGHKFFYS